jgi:hypothetical protein
MSTALSGPELPQPFGLVAPDRRPQLDGRGHTSAAFRRRHVTHGTARIFPLTETFTGGRAWAGPAARLSLGPRRRLNLRPGQVFYVGRSERNHMEWAEFAIRKGDRVAGGKDLLHTLPTPIFTIAQHCRPC